MRPSYENIRRGSAALALGLTALASIATASETAPRQPGAHAHGHGVLNVVVEGDELAIELRVPAVNVVGFEHAPANDDQRRAVDDALTRFRAADRLFVPTPAAQCRPEHVQVALEGVTHGEHRADHDHRHQEPQARPPREQESRAQEHGEGHDGDHAGGRREGASGEAHAELHGEYHFHCDAPAALDRLEVRVLEHLNAIEKLDARVVTATRQTAQALRPGATALELPRE